MNTNLERNANGTFAVGNSGGPGRPPRLVERDYLACLGDSVTMEVWKMIVAAAVNGALEGDAKSREWLGKHLLGKAPTEKPLMDVARRELQGLTSQEEIQKYIDRDNSFQWFADAVLT